MTKDLTLGFSPCPNDTFMFYPLVHGLVDTAGLTFRERLEDVETLNRLALAGELDVTKVSYHALGHIRDQYALLRSGSALGRGCGPAAGGTGTRSTRPTCAAGPSPYRGSTPRPCCCCACSTRNWATSSSCPSTRSWMPY